MALCYFFSAKILCHSELMSCLKFQTALSLSLSCSLSLTHSHSRYRQDKTGKDRFDNIYTCNLYMYRCCAYVYIFKCGCFTVSLSLSRLRPGFLWSVSWLPLEHQWALSWQRLSTKSSSTPSCPEMNWVGSSTLVLPAPRSRVRIALVGILHSPHVTSNFHTHDTSEECWESSALSQGVLEHGKQAKDLVWIGRCRYISALRWRHFPWG